MEYEKGDWMADPAGFEEFVAGRSQSLLRTAYLLTLDWGLAEDLLQTALTRSWFAWKRIEGPPEVYVRKVMVDTSLSWRRRRWVRERPSEAVPEDSLTDPAHAVDDRDEVWRLLAELPPRQRAVLVLRYIEDLTEVQAADALGVSVGTVKSQAAKALASIRRSRPLPGRLGGHLTELRDLIGERLASAPDNPDRMAQVAARIARRRRRAARATVAAFGLALAALIGRSASTAGDHVASASELDTAPAPGTDVLGELSSSDAPLTGLWFYRPPDQAVTFVLRCVAAGRARLTSSAGTLLGELDCEHRVGRVREGRLTLSSARLRRVGYPFGAQQRAVVLSRTTLRGRGCSAPPSGTPSTASTTSARPSRGTPRPGCSPPWTDAPGPPGEP